MCCRYYLAPFRKHLIQQGNCQDSSFSGVCACAYFIEQNQSPVVRSVQDLHNLPHMGRESTEVLLNALLVSDIGVYLPVDGDRRIRTGRNVHTALGHEGKKANCLEHYGLSPGVRACNQQQIKVFSQPHINRYYLIHRIGHLTGSLFADPPQEKRMSGLPQPKAAVGIQLWR